MKTATSQKPNAVNGVNVEELFKKRSPVFDIVSNPVPVSVELQKNEQETR
jgi:hypothetical protein